MCLEFCPNTYEMVDHVCYPGQEYQLEYYLQHSPFRMRWNQSNFKKIIVLVIIFVLSFSLAILTISYFISRIFQRFIIFLALLILIYVSLVLTDVLPCPQPLIKLLTNLTLREKQVCVGIFGFLVLTLIAWIVCFNKQLTWNGLMIDYASKILP